MVDRQLDLIPMMQPSSMDRFFPTGHEKRPPPSLRPCRDWAAIAQAEHAADPAETETFSCEVGPAPLVGA